ncbi:MAG: NAD(P)-dependent oxidoreductase [Chitinophagales bacterium]|nr:NAD(P)-dependent oxidoreductase [Chitinophagales bacterium]
MTKILITGITGLIGKHLMFRILNENQYEIKGQYFSQKDISSYIALGVEMKQANICLPESINNLCSSCEIVVHSAAKVIDFGTKEDFYLAHYDATKWLLEDALKNGVKQFIYISSFGPATYIDRSKGLPDESTPLVKSGVHYDDAKIDTENLVKEFCLQHHIIYSIIRPAAVIGPDSVWVREPLKRAQSALGVTLIDNGKFDACLIDVDNLADGIYRTITMPIAKNQTYFFMDDYGITWKKYFTDLLSMKDYQIKGSINKKTALFLAKILGFLYPLFGKTPPISIKSIMATGSERRVNISKARNELKWKSNISYEESLEKIKKSISTI